MADRTLVTYQESRLDDGPYWTLSIERSAGGTPGLFFVIRHKSFGDSYQAEELSVFVDDGKKLLEPVLKWLDE